MTGIKDPQCRLRVVGSPDRKDPKKGTPNIVNPPMDVCLDQAPRTLLERFKRFVRSDMFDLVVGLCVTGHHKGVTLVVQN